MASAASRAYLCLAILTSSNAHFWLFLCGIRFRFKLRFRVSVRVRLKVLLTRLTLGVLHAFVRECLARLPPKSGHVCPALESEVGGIWG